MRNDRIPILTTARLCTFEKQRLLTNASSFFSSVTTLVPGDEFGT